MRSHVVCLTAASRSPDVAVQLPDELLTPEICRLVLYKFPKVVRSWLLELLKAQGKTPKPDEAATED